MLLPSRARLMSRCPAMATPEILENPVIPTLRARDSRHAVCATMCRWIAEQAARRNKILTIFAPFTFSHSQGQFQLSPPTPQNPPAASGYPSHPDPVSVVARISALCQLQTHAAQQFANPIRSLHWPERAVMQALRGRATWQFSG